MLTIKRISFEFLLFTYLFTKRSEKSSRGAKRGRSEEEDFESDDEDDEENQDSDSGIEMFLFYKSIFILIFHSENIVN
jgi:hypothetical protein